MPNEVSAMTCSTFEGSAPSETWTEVTALFVASFSAPPYEEDPEELALISTWGPATLARQRGRLAVARESGRLAGFALVHRLAEDEPWQSILATLAEHPTAAAALHRPDSALVVRELAVREDVRGRGVARACLREVLRDRDETHVVLGVHESATDAVAVYRRWGLAQVGAFRGPDSDVTLLVLTLPRRTLHTRLHEPSPPRD